MSELRLLYHTIRLCLYLDITNEMNCFAVSALLCNKYFGFAFAGLGLELNVGM